MSHNNLLEISPLILQHKRNHLTFCDNCQYFPIYNQLQQQIMCQTIYQIKWICSYCKKINKTVTDMHFKYYCFNYIYSYRLNGLSGKRQYKGGMIIDQVYCRKSQLLIYIDISLMMKEEWIWLGEGAGKRVNNTGKKQMILESNLLKTYLQTQAIKMRLQKGRYFSWQTFLKQKILSKLQYGFWLADRLKNLQKDTTQIVFFNNQQQVVSNKILNQIFFRKLSKYGNNYPNTIASSLFINSEKLIQNPPSIIIITSSPLKQISQKCIKLSNKLKFLIINLQQMYDPISLNPTSTAKFHQNKLHHNISSQLIRPSQPLQTETIRSSSQNNNLHEYTTYHQTHSQPKHEPHSPLSQFFEFSNTKQQKLLIFDSKLLNINSLTQAKQIITYLLQQQQQQIFIFMQNKPKKNRYKGSHFHREIPQENNWTKIIDRQLRRNLIIQKYKKQNNKVKYQIYPNQKQIKIKDILAQYYNILSKQTTISIQQLQLFLQNTAITICKDSQIKIMLRFSTKYQIKQINNNMYNNLQLSQLINQNVYKYTILWYKSKINININNYQQNIFKYIMGGRQLQIMNLNDDQYISDKYDNVQDIYGKINQKEKDDKVSYTNCGWILGYGQEANHQQYL